MTEKINVSSLKNAKFENMTAEQVIKKYEEVLNSREKQIYELSAEIGQITKKTQKMKAKYENCKEQNTKLKNIFQKKEILLKQELDNKELMFMQLTKKEKECDEIQKKIDDFALYSFRILLSFFVFFYLFGRFQLIVHKFVFLVNLILLHIF